MEVRNASGIYGLRAERERERGCASYCTPSPARHRASPANSVRRFPTSRALALPHPGNKPPTTITLRPVRVCFSEKLHSVVPRDNLRTQPARGDAR